GENDGQQAPGQTQPTSQQVPTAAPAMPSPSPIAPPGRFGGARRSLGNFARSGDSSDMRRGVKHYIRSGYGGVGTAVRRFGGTASTADALNGALSSVA